MNKLLTFLLIGLFLFSLTSVSAFLDSKDSIDLRTGDKYTLGERQIDYKPIWEEYKPIEITTWFGLGTTIFKGALTEHTSTCGGEIGCLSEMEIYLDNKGVLIEEMIWERSFDGGKTWVRWHSFVNWKIMIENKNRYLQQDIFETICLDTETISKNGTKIQECSQVKVGTETIDTGEWESYQIGKEVEAGNYKIKIEGSKKNSTLLDWKIKTQGKILDELAIWGTIGVDGAEAEVTLNSPSNGETIYTNSVTTNATGNVTASGVYLVNATEFSNSTGTWGARNTTNLTMAGATNNSIFLTETNIEIFTDQTLTFNSKAIGIITQIAFGTDAVTTSLASITIVQGGNTILQKQISTGGAQRYKATFTDADYTSPIQEGEFTIRWLKISGGNPVRKNSGQTYDGTLFSYTSQKIPTHNTEAVIVFNQTLQTNSPQTFTNTYSAGDNILWNMQFCDTDGDCGFAPSNFTFSIDGTAPTIDFGSGYGIQDYGNLNTNHTISFTATDVNFDKVWVLYNNTVRIIGGAVSGVVNLYNFSMLKNAYKVTVFANDSIGNTANSSINWSYKVFENSHSYVNETYSKVSNTFLTNITSPNVSSLKLNYDGVNYTANSYPSGLDTIASVSVTSPLVSEDTNKSFYWIFLLNNETILNPNIYNQSIRYLALGNNYSNLIYNISVRNENNNSLISNQNVTISYEVDYGFTSDTLLGTSIFNDNKLANKNISSNIFTSLFMEGDMLFASDNYIGRNYYFLENNISSPKNITLYMASDSEGFVKQIIVTDEAGRGIPATFKQYRNIGGVNTVVSSEKLDSTGRSTISFIPNVQYTFEFSNEGCSNLTKTIIFYDQADYSQTLSCSSYNPDDYEDEFEGMLVSFSPSGLFNVTNETELEDSNFFATVSGKSSFCNNVDAISFSVYDDTNTLIGNDNANSCDELEVSGYFANFAKGTLYILLDSGTEKTINFRWQKIYSVSDYSNYNILDLLKEVGNSDDILGIDWKFKLLISFIGLFAIIISVTILQRKYNFSNIFTLVIADIYLWFVSFINWSNLNFGSTAGGFTSLISRYAIFILALIATVGLISTKEDEYS